LAMRMYVYVKYIRGTKFHTKSTLRSALVDISMPNM